MAQAASLGRVSLEASAGLLAGLVQERLGALPHLAATGLSHSSDLFSDLVLGTANGPSST